jgi:hypothetical protein
MEESYYPPRLSSFFIFLLSSVIFLSSTLLFLLNQKTLNTNTPRSSVVMITPIPSAWKAYTNTTYTYTIQYPSDWTVDTNSSNSAIVTLQGPTESIIIDPTNTAKISEPIKDWIQKSNQELEKDPNRPSFSSPMFIVPYHNELKIKEMPVAIDNSFFGSGGTSYIFSHNHTIFYISSSYFYEDQSTESTPSTVDTAKSQLINQILSTFRFIDPSEASAKGDEFLPSSTSDWKIYQNPEYGLKFENINSSWSLESVKDYIGDAKSITLRNSEQSTSINIAFMRKGEEGQTGPTGIADNLSKEGVFLLDGNQLQRYYNYYLDDTTKTKIVYGVLYGDTNKPGQDLEIEPSNSNLILSIRIKADSTQEKDSLTSDKIKSAEQILSTFKFTK